MPKLAWLILISLSAPVTSLAADPVFPDLSGRVVDDADILDSAQETELSRLLERHETATTNQVVVVTLKSLQGYAIEEFGYRLGRHWGIGQKDGDNGALLIIAPNERQVRIEVGYGLEGQLTDAISKPIIELAIIPAFRDGDYAAGTKAGVLGMVAALEGDTTRPQVDPTRLQDDATSRKETGPFAFILFIIYLAALGAGMVMMYINAPKQDPPETSGRAPNLRNHLKLYSFGGLGSRRRGGTGAGSGGGFRGGGGSFGGGGASGRW